MGELAEMEHALVSFTVKKLLARKFKLISVPDILPSQIIEFCGMTTRGDRTQVYVTVYAQESEYSCFKSQLGTYEEELLGMFLLSSLLC
jgi:seryl-tRNA synthetase